MQGLANAITNDVVKVWFADDSSAVGPLKWWDYSKTKGPDFGYCSKCEKNILILKKQRAAKEIFNNTDQGEHHLGTVIVTESFKEQFIKIKVNF